MNTPQIAKISFVDRSLRYGRVVISAVAIPLLAACSSVGNTLNPFYEPPAPVALLGEMNDKAISGGAQNEDKARAALEHMASYQAARSPQPYNPVVQPAVIRLMWVPDHLNKSGDMVPAHYYYLKVLKDRWAVTDAFELEEQLSPNKAGGGAGLPFVPSDESQNYN